MSAKWRKFMKEARALIDRGAYPEAEQALLAAVREVEVAPDDREFLSETLYETGKLMARSSRVRNTHRTSAVAPR